MSLVEKSLEELSDMLADRRIAAMELLNEYLEIALKGCCITFCNESAYETVKRIDERRMLFDASSPIEGLPFSMKDNIPVKGVLTTCNSRCLKSNVPDASAPLADRLDGLGAVLTAKSCMREFSVGKIEDSAYDIRNYINWAGTNKNINIGAFSVGTDVGLSDFYCGLWSFKPSYRADELMEGIISGAPSLERVAVSARRADDLSFLYPFLYSSERAQPQKARRANDEYEPKKIKILVYDNQNMPDYIIGFLEGCGFSVEASAFGFLDKAGLLYDCILCTEFFSKLRDIGLPETEGLTGSAYDNEYIKNRSEGFGFETKRLVLTGAHLLSPRNKRGTAEIIGGRGRFVREMLAQLNTYDFIAAPALYGDLLSKASAVARLPELTVPFGDVLSFKLVAHPKREKLLLNAAKHLWKRL